MEMGILGLAQSGKSTLFEIMTGIRSREIFGSDSVRGVAKVPDRRFDELVRIFKPAKITPAAVPFIDTCATGDNQWESIRKALSGADGLLHVVDGFTACDAAEVTKRYGKLADELVISDLVVVETRLARLSKLQRAAMKPDEAMQAELLPRAKDALEAGMPLRDVGFKPDEIRALCGFAFWTLRPELAVVNCREDSLSMAEVFGEDAKTAAPVIGICCQMEAEVAELAPDERLAFLDSMGVTEPAFERIIRTSFSLLGRICYFTVGEDEVRAWVIPKSSTAPRAAAAIHKDFERGFIKAEVVSYDDFIKCGATLAAAKSAGKLRLEGKEYIVADGDIISFRFNV